MMDQKGSSSYSESRAIIPDELFIYRLQDMGCEKAKFPKPTYDKNKVIDVGHIGEEVHYYDLSAIAIDHTNIFANTRGLD